MWCAKAFKKIPSMWMFCADNYLAPTYNDCFETVDDLFVTIDEGNLEDWQKMILEMQGYMMCSRNMTMQWVTERRPEHADEVMYFLTMGGNPTPQMDMDDM